MKHLYDHQDNDQKGRYSKHHVFKSAIEPTIKSRRPNLREAHTQTWAKASQSQSKVVKELSLVLKGTNRLI